MSSEKKKNRPPGAGGSNNKIHRYFDIADRPASSSLAVKTGPSANSTLGGRMLPHGQFLSSSQSHAPISSSGSAMPSLRPSFTKSSSERVIAHPGTKFVDGAIARRSATPNRVEGVRESEDATVGGIGKGRGSPIQVVMGSKPINKDDFMVVGMERRSPSPGERELTAPRKARRGGKGSRSGTNTPAELVAELEKLPAKRSRPVEGKMAVPKMRDDGWSRNEDEAPKKRKGRPPGSKNKATVVAGAIVSNDGPREGLPGVAAPGGTPMNRRGRPPGWKPGMKYSEMRGSDPNPRPRATGAKRGRRPKMSILQVHHNMDVPFTSYVCEWKGCTAELHNLDTLRKHVKVIHLGMGRRGALREGSRECLWGKCGNVEEMERRHVGGDVLRHMEKKHFIPLAWHAGDGPKNSLEEWEKLVADFRADEKMKKMALSGREQRAADRGEADVNEGERAEKKLPRWLFDEYGKQVTESIEGQRLENTAEIKARKKRLKEWKEKCLYTSSDEDDEDGDEGKEGQGDVEEVLGSGRE